MSPDPDDGPAAVPCAPADLTAIRVLVIDDEPHMRVFLRTALRSLGVRQIHEAANGEEGVTRFREHRPTLVLLDVHMPVLGGEAALPQILAIDPDAAVVIVTTDSQQGTVRRLLDLGAKGFVLKHRAVDGLCQALTELINRLCLAGDRNDSI
jgi:two-component system chemotaxis response regulator CheY